MKLFDNLRFYVLAGTVCLSVLIVSLLRLHIPDDQLFYIRCEQCFGYLAIVYWYGILLLSPLSKLRHGRVMQQLLFSRRALGVSVAYFALSHTVIAVWAQIGGLHGLTILPNRFDWSLGFATVALVVLLMMAAVSFDAAIKFMTPRRWKWLGRLGYLAGVLVIVHVWLIGTHIAYVDTQLIALGALGVLFGFESFRIAGSLARRYTDLAHKDMLLTLTVCVWLLMVGALVALPQVTGNYHSQHHAGTGGHNDH